MCKQCGKLLVGWFEEENNLCEDCLLTEPCSNCGEMVKTDEMVQSFYAQGWLCPECAEAIEKEAKHVELPSAS